MMEFGYSRAGVVVGDDLREADEFLREHIRSPPGNESPSPDRHLCCDFLRPTLYA